MPADHLFDIPPQRPGYRLHRFELFNWGTFDSTSGTVYRFEPEGRTCLLVGNNGSGKSTIVDAALTLLVPAHIRNYNVAAGAKKTERSEKSYIRGAYGRGSDDSETAVTKLLRPKANHLTALLAVFRDEQLERSFTLCQVLYLAGDGTSEKVFCLSDEVRDLKRDLGGLKSSDMIRGHFQRLGYQTTKTFTDYESWIAKRTGMQSKAMDMFNQTVAVKDIQSLNEFIRRHMLEPHDWREKVQRLLTHFNDLSAAHQELVRTRLAETLLTPVETRGGKYREHARNVDALQRQLDASTTFFAVETVRLCQPEFDRRSEDLKIATATKERLAIKLKSNSDTIRKLANDIDSAGGQRLRDIPVIISREEAFLENKREGNRVFHENLRLCGINEQALNSVTFAARRHELQSLAESTEAKLAARVQEHELALAACGHLRQQLRSEQEELNTLAQRPTKLNSHMTSLRGRMCEDLHLSESELPFAAELISVPSEERRWEASIEMVLRSFGMSLLVPDRLYQRVRAYVERTKITNDKGEGQRLVYLRVGRIESKADAGDRLHRQSILRKLRFRVGHDLIPWVRGELLRRFDFRCCESIEEFNEVDRLGMTENRHVKVGSDRHEKDDRPRAVEPRHYILGWDNREKQRMIAQQIEGLQQEIKEAETAIQSQSSRLDGLRGQRDSAVRALKVTDFDSIDFLRHQVCVEELQREREKLESSNEAIKALRAALQKAQDAEQRLTDERDAAVKLEQSLSDQIAREAEIIAGARREIEASRNSGVYDVHAQEFEPIAASLGESLSIENLFVLGRRWPADTQREVNRQRDNLKPITEQLLRSMGDYMKEFKEESDLSASVNALDSFLGRLQQIRHEDLPRHERRFKDRLNDKVSQEVALLHGTLRQECKEIEGKIVQLNASLAALEYQPGTFMRLEPREVKDSDIANFRRSLRECLDESLENNDEANEARFVRIQKLIDRLANPDNARWRDKVIDVRNWFDFAAREVQKEDGRTRSFYQDSSGQSGGEKAKLAFTILVAAIAYQYDLDPTGKTPGRFQFVVVDEMFSKVDDQNAKYALRLFQQFGLQLLIVAPLDAKARVTESFVDCYLHSVKDSVTHHSELYSMTAQEYEEVVNGFPTGAKPGKSRRVSAK